MLVAILCMRRGDGLAFTLIRMCDTGLDSGR